MSVPKPYAEVNKILENQKAAYESGDLHLASIITDLNQLPSRLKPEITFTKIGNQGSETEKVQERSERVSETDQTPVSEKKVKSKKKQFKKPSSQNSSEAPQS